MYKELDIMIIVLGRIANWQTLGGKVPTDFYVQAIEIMKMA